VIKKEREESLSNVEILLSREGCSMVSVWDEYLGLVRVAGVYWRLSLCRYDTVGSIYDLVPEDQLFDDDGELIVPEFWDGKKIISLEDGEYLLVDELVEGDEYVEFSASSIDLAREFCEAGDWTEQAGFGPAWARIECAVNPLASLSSRSCWPELEVLRNVPAHGSGLPPTELGIVRGEQIQLWDWRPDAPIACIHTVDGPHGFGAIVQWVAGSADVRTRIDWDSLEFRGLASAQGLLLAAAWSSDEASRTAARLTAKIPDRILEPFLSQTVLNGSDICAMGERLRSHARKHSVNVEDLRTLRLRAAGDLPQLERRLKNAFSRFSRRKQIS
jgi:hypothetical protein